MPSTSTNATTTNVCRNNILSSSISSLGFTASETRSFLSSPQNYLSGLSADEAERVRALVIPAYKRGFRIIFVIGGALAAFAFCLAFALMPQVELNRADDAKLKEEAKKRVDEKNAC
jgi:hypothetical protein